MNLKALLVSLSFALVAAFSVAADSAAPSAPTADLETLVNRIGTKLKAGEKSAEALAPELQAFEALEEKYRGQKSDEVAQIHFMHALLHVQVLNDVARGKEMFERIQAGFPDTRFGAAAGEAIASLGQRAAAENAKAALVGKPAPELNFTWATRDDLNKLSELKGKVVVLDFWATWCGPCVASFPNVRELTAHYANRDVVVLGVTSLQGRVHGLQAAPIDTRADPKKEYALMNDYIKAKDITWTVAFSEQEVFNPEYGVQGIPHMVIIAPDGTVRHPGLHPGGPIADKVAKIDALLKEFGKL